MADILTGHIRSTGATDTVSGSFKSWLFASTHNRGFGTGTPIELWLAMMSHVKTFA